MYWRTLLRLGSAAVEKAEVDRENLWEWSKTVRGWKNIIKKMCPEHNQQVCGEI